MTRVVFLGTPDFAVPSLEALVRQEFEVVGVVTQPDRPAGRGGKLTPSPLKVAALRHGLTILQPATLRTPEAIAGLRALQPDLLVVAAYGQILRRSVLELPPLGCLNVHPSLLPRFRGASPMQAAIREGDTKTGVTIMLMNERMDAGPILSQVRAPIFPDDTGASLSDRLARLGADLLVETIPRWQAGRIEPRAQDDSAATYCRPLKKEDANIDWAQPADVIERTCRAQTPWPGCQAFWNGHQLRFLAFESRPQWRGREDPGTVFLLPGASPNRPILAVATGDGAVEVRQLQLAGKRPLSAAEFFRGQPGIVGARLTAS